MWRRGGGVSWMEWVWVCVCASRADEMKNGGHLKYMCQQNANPNNNEGLHVPA